MRETNCVTLVNFRLPLQGLVENLAANCLENDGRPLAVRDIHHSFVKILGVILE